MTVFRIIASKACKLNWKSKNVEYTFCWNVYEYCKFLSYLAVLKNEENEVLLRVSAEHFVSTSHEGKYTDHFTFAWDITVSQVIINNIVFLHICIYEVRALILSSSILIRDLRIHTSFHHFMEISKICHKL